MGRRPAYLHGPRGTWGKRLSLIHIYGVVDESEEQILPDVAHGRPAQVAGTEDAGEVAFYQGDAAALHGDVGAGAHGDAHVGLRERGRVVDAVAGHGDHSSLLLQLADHVQLPFRQDSSFEFVDAQLLRDEGGCESIVACNHDDAHALRPELPYYLCSRRLDGIGQR